MIFGSLILLRIEGAQQKESIIIPVIHVNERAQANVLSRSFEN